MKRPEDDKEFMEVVGHLISHPRFQKLDGIVQHHHSTRLEHSVNVSYTSYKIAKKFGWDAKSTARGGLLHDFFYYDWRVTKLIRVMLGYTHVLLFVMPESLLI